MYPGDFEEIYGADEGNDNDQEPQSGRWDAILTCFFIDTVSPASTQKKSVYPISDTGKEHRQLSPHYSSYFSTRGRLDQSW